MEHSKFSYVLPLFFLLFLSLAVANDLGSLCFELEGHYIPYTTCKEIFGRDPRSNTATYKQLAVIIVDIVITNATSIEDKVNSILKNESSNITPLAKSVLVACSKIYSNGFGILSQAKDSVARQDFKGAASFLLKYGEVPQACINVAQSKKLGIHDLDLLGRSGALINLAFSAQTVNEIVSRK